MFELFLNSKQWQNKLNKTKQKKKNKKNRAYLALPVQPPEPAQLLCWSSTVRPSPPPPPCPLPPLPGGRTEARRGARPRGLGHLLLPPRRSRASPSRHHDATNPPGGPLSSPSLAALLPLSLFVLRPNREPPPSFAATTPTMLLSPPRVVCKLRHRLLRRLEQAPSARTPQLDRIDSSSSFGRRRSPSLSRRPRPSPSTPTVSS